MNKEKFVSEFLDYGGNELFSQLMGKSSGRDDALGRLIELLKFCADFCPFIRGRSAAYRSMVKKAVKNGWLSRDSRDLKGHFLTDEERNSVLEALNRYILSGGRSAKLVKAVLIAVAAAAILAAAAFFTVREFEGLAGGWEIWG